MRENREAERQREEGETEFIPKPPILVDDGEI